MLQLKEFLDENSHRSYPFKYPNTVPTELILDIHILISGVTSTIDYKDSVGISRVVVSKTGMSITFVIVDGGSATDIGTIHVPSTEPQKTHTFSLYKSGSVDGILVDGSITTGYFSNDFIGTYNISPDNESTDNRILFEGCVIPVTNWCTGMVINDKLYTGLVTINAGEGIVIEDTATADGWDLNFKLKEYNTISNDTIKKEIQDQFKAIVDTQGFIKTINGVGPDAEGNINITVGEPVDAEPPSYVEGATIIHDNGFINTIAVDAGLNSSIVIRDVITPFCYDEASFTIDDAVLETLKSNATELAERVQTIENHLTALENNLNTVNMQLVKMG